MRVRRLLGVTAIIVALFVSAVLFLLFKDFGSSGEPVVNGMRLRRFVAAGPFEKGLAAIGPDAIPWLIKGLDAEESAFHKVQVRAWKLLPRASQQKWRNRAPIDPTTLRVNCVRALELFGLEAVVAVPKLIEVASTKSNSFARALAFNALARMASDSPRAKALLVESLRNGDTAIKAEVAGAFFNASHTPGEAAPLLIARLENYAAPDADSPVPLNEMLALSVCGSKAAPAAPLLLQYTKGDLGRGNAVSALRATGPAAIVTLPRLLEILKDADEAAVRLKPGIYDILARLGTSGVAALPTLTNGLSDPSPVVQALAAAGIANITGDVGFAIPKLIEQLENPQRSGESLTVKKPWSYIGLNHRQLSAQLLGELGPRATNALPHLKEALNSKDIWLPAIAAAAIWKISRDTNAVLPFLIAGLKDTRMDPKLILETLADMGPAAAPAIPTVRKAMQSELQVRQCGYIALQKINQSAE